MRITAEQIVTGIIISIVATIFMSIIAFVVTWTTQGGLIKFLGGASQKQIMQLDEKISRATSWASLINQKERQPSSTPIVPESSTPWGTWEAPAYCPKNQYICGIEQRVEGKQGDGDDTAMNGLRFYCCPL